MLKKELTKEHKRNISIANTGKIRTKETKERLKKRPQHFKVGHIPWNKGKKTNIKSQSCFKKGSVPWNKGKKGFHKSEESIKKYKEWRKTQKNLVKDTSIEVKIQNFLKQLDITFLTHQYIKEIEHGYQCDILMPSMNLIIECDGCYWHGCNICKKQMNIKVLEQIEKDKLRNKELIDKGYRVIRLWEHDIKKMNIKDFQYIILKNYGYNNENKANKINIDFGGGDN